MRIKNLTPHSIVLVSCPGDEFETKRTYPSRGVARVSTMETVVGTCHLHEDCGNTVPIVKLEEGEVTGLPREDSCEYDKQFYIVSAMVRAACPDRKDLLSPGGLVRDREGRVVGCTSLIIS